MWYNQNAHSIQFQTDFPAFDAVPGQIEYIRVYNDTGAQIALGKPVYIVGVKGTSNPVDSRILSVALADATDALKKDVIGLTGHNIPNGSEGFVVARGPIYGLDTSALNSDQRFHLGPSPGELIPYAPEYPYWPTDLGTCLVVDPTVGTVYVDIFDHSIERLRLESDGYVGGNFTTEGSLTVLGEQFSVSKNSLKVGGKYLYLSAGDTIDAGNTTFTGTGLDDLSFRGTYEGDPASTSYYVRIDSVGIDDTFEWSFNSSFSPLQGSNIVITTARQPLANGISVQFNSVRGHTVGDKWAGVAYTSNLDFGIIGHYNDGTYTHAGLFRDATDGEFKFFNRYRTEPEEDDIEIANSTFQLGNVRVEKITANSFFADGVNLLSAINSAANASAVYANGTLRVSNAPINFVNTSTIRATVSGSGLANVSFDLIGSGGIASFPVVATGQTTVSANGLTFVNSATVGITVTQGTSGNANISFTTLAGGGTVTQVGTGLGLTGGPITTSGTVSANIASTTVQGVTKLIDSVTSTDAANAATAASVRTAFNQGTSAFAQANAAFTQANSANSIAISAFGQANAAIAAANNAANTVRVSANGGSTLSAKQLNFVNSSNVLVTITDSGTGNANVSFATNISATEILDKIKTVDGSGSGLDADLLDGVSGNQFLRSDTSSTQNNGILTIGTNGNIAVHDPGRIFLNPTIAGVNANSFILTYGSTPTSITGIPGDGTIWHDLLAFRKQYTCVFETYDGATWSAGTINNDLFAQKENQSITQINGTTVLGARWKFSDVSWSSGAWLDVGFTYPGATSTSKTVTVESSADDVNWVVRHQSTNTLSAQRAFLRLDSYSGDIYLRISIVWNSGLAVPMSHMRLLSARSGDQGRGKELEYPYTWDGNQNIISGNNFTANASLTVNSTSLLRGNVTINPTANLIIGTGSGLVASGSLGSAGQVLASNGSSVYWTNVSDAAAFNQANLAYSAANNASNTVRVSANSGSTLSNVTLNFVNTSTVQVSVTSGGTGIANIAFTSTANGGGGGSGTLNTIPVSVNTGSTVAANGINFVNSASVTVSVTQGIGGNANISFTAITSGTGTVTSVGTGTGLTGGPISSSGTISANIASTTVQGVTKLVDSVTSTDSANAATAASVKVAYDQATTAYGQANAAYAQANSANSIAISAYGQANLAYAQANTANSTAVAAYGQANAAFAAANNAANTVRVTANSGSTQSAASLNFINTSSVQVSVGAGSAGDANVGFSVASASPSVRGIVQLNDTVINNSTTLAPTANALKTTYDFAATKYSSTGGTISGDVTITGNLILTGGTSQLNVTNLSVNDSIILLGSNNISDVLDIGFVGHYRRGATDTHAGIIRKATDKTFYVFDNYEVEPTNNVIDITGNNFRLGNVRLGVMNANSILVLGTSVATVTDVGVAYTQANAAFAAANNAANTTRVSANSGSTLSNVSLNFVNTSTVQVSVTSGGTGVANIAFTSAADGVTSVATGTGLSGGTITSTGTITANIASTTVVGVTKLIDSVTSTDAANAATASSVKAAFDQATLAYGQANTANSTAVAAYGQANLAYAAANSAANAVRVTANSGSTLSNVSLNFVNTSTVQVSVTSGPTGFANIAFTSTATGTGSGINTFPVSANAGATVSANGINFINSATVTVTVTPGVNGNANVSFTSTGGAGTPGGSNTQIQFNNNGSFGGSPKFTYNTAPNLVSVDADLKLANTNKLYFGGEQANNSVANSKFSISFNVSATSLDFTFLG